MSAAREGEAHIDLHWHAGIRANWRLTSDHGDPQFFGSGFPNTDAGRYEASYPVSVARDVETVIVDGQVVMEQRHIPDAPALDQLLARAQAFAEAYWLAYASLDWQGSTAAEAFPNAFPWVE